MGFNQVRGLLGHHASHWIHPLTIQESEVKALDVSNNKSEFWKNRKVTLEFHWSDAVISLFAGLVIFSPIVYAVLTARRKIEAIPNYELIHDALNKNIDPVKTNAVAIKVLNSGYKPEKTFESVNNVYKLKSITADSAAMLKFAAEKNDHPLALEIFDVTRITEDIESVLGRAYDINIFLKLITHAYTLGLKNEKGHTPLYTVLNSNSARMNLKDKQTQNVAKGQPDLIKNALAKWINIANEPHKDVMDDPNAGTVLNQYNYLQYVSRSPFVDFDLLINTLGFDVNFQDPQDGLTAMHWAAGQGGLQNVKSLISLGGRLDILTNLGSKKRPLFTALMNEKQDVVDYILQHHNDELLTLAGMAVRDKNPIVLEWLLRNSPDQLNELDGNGLSPLHHAATVGDLECTTILLKGAANIEGGNDQHPTPLYFAASSGKWDVVKLLLEHGAKAVEAFHKHPDVPAGKTSMNALHYALASDQAEIAKVLCDMGLNFNIPLVENKLRITPIEIAFLMGPESKVYALFQKQIDMLDPKSPILGFTVEQWTKFREGDQPGKAEAMIALKGFKRKYGPGVQAELQLR